MQAIMNWLNDALHYMANIGISLLEFAGIIVVMITAAKAVYGYFTKDPHIRLKLAQGIALGLEFKLGGEVLHTVIARDWNELIILGAIIILRGLLTVLLHWEIKTEEERADRCVVPFAPPPSHPLEEKITVNTKPSEETVTIDIQERKSKVG